MRTRKARLTVTVDQQLLDAGAQAVASGRARSLSSWVNLALSDRAARERKLLALGEAIASWEAKHGAISADELTRQLRADRAAAVVVRGRRATRGRRSGAA